MRVLKFKDKDTRRSSESYNRLFYTDASKMQIDVWKDPYEKLACSVVAVAADDYREALKTGNEELRAEVEEFFYSDWYRVLSRIDPNLIVGRIREELGFCEEVFN